jgi:inner membrane protein
VPTILTHPAVPLALALGTGRRVTSLRLLAAGAFCSALPDFDALGYWAGVPYDHVFGHRGFTHSLFFAGLVGLLACAAAPQLRASRAWAFVFVVVTTASHGLLDTLTNGGLGIALLSPFSNHRFFAPWRPIPVSPIGVHGLASARGLSLFAAEYFLVWLPCLTLGAIAFMARRLRAAPATRAT